MCQSFEFSYDHVSDITDKTTASLKFSNLFHNIMINRLPKAKNRNSDNESKRFGMVNRRPVCD